MVVWKSRGTTLTQRDDCGKIKVVPFVWEALWRRRKAQAVVHKSTTMKQGSTSARIQLRLWKQFASTRTIRKGDIAEYGNLPSANRLVENYDKKFGNQINIQLFAANYTRQTEKQLEKSLKSHQDNIREHQFKINNPTKFYAKWETMTQIERDGRLQQWEKEIKNFQNQVSKIEEELNKRRKANGSERNH